MEQELRDALAVQTEKLDAIARDVARMRRAFLWTLILSVVCIVLPLVGLAFVVPQYLSMISGF